VTEAYEAVVFDCDGVLVEPTDTAVLVEAVVDAFDAFGVEIDRAAARRSVTEDIAPVETAREHDIDPEAFWHYRELTASLAQQAHVRAGGKQVYKRKQREYHGPPCPWVKRVTTRTFNRKRIILKPSAIVQTHPNTIVWTRHPHGE